MKEEILENGMDEEGEYDEEEEEQEESVEDESELVAIARRKMSKTWQFHVFLLAAGFLALSEPLIVSLLPVGGRMQPAVHVSNNVTLPSINLDQDPHNINWAVQVAIIVLSTVFAMIGTLWTAYSIDSEDINFIDKLMESIDREVIIEIFFLIYGWICIFAFPIFAALRCFRIFRFVWYFQLVISEQPDDYIPSQHWISVTKSSKLCVLYLESLGYFRILKY